ncbi:MAG: hypothetical protein QM784_38495 [Polyangiaceae bacterium]
MLLVSAIALGLHLTSTPPTTSWVRVWGVREIGEGADLVLRLTAGRLDPLSPGVEGSSLLVRVRDGAGRVRERWVKLDEDSNGIVQFERGLLPPLRITIVLEGQCLFDDVVAFEHGAMSKRLTYRPAWMTARGTGTSRFRVASRDGRFVLGRKTLLVVDAFVGEQRALPADVELELEGFRAERSSSLRASAVDSRGRFVLPVVPTDLVASARLRARSSGEESFAQIPIDQQGFWAESDGDSIRIRSLVPLTHLHYAIVSARALWARGRVELRCDDGADCGASMGAFGAPRGDERFVVLGREPSLDGPLSIGWALDDGSEEPRQTVLFRETLLMDGMLRARQVDRERAARRTTRTLVGFGVVGTAFLLTVLLRLWVARREIERFALGDSAEVVFRQSVERSDDSDEVQSLPMASSRRALGWVLFLTLSLLALGVWVWTRLS